MSTIQNLYIQFLNYFPAALQPVISIVIVVLIVYAIFRIIQKDFIYIILLVVLLPASIPVLQSIWSGIVSFVQFLLGSK